MLMMCMCVRLYIDKYSRYDNHSPQSTTARNGGGSDNQDNERNGSAKSGPEHDDDIKTENDNDVSGMKCDGIWRVVRFEFRITFSSVICLTGGCRRFANQAGGRLFAATTNIKYNTVDTNLIDQLRFGNEQGWQPTSQFGREHCTGRYAQRMECNKTKQQKRNG